MIRRSDILKNLVFSVNILFLFLIISPIIGGDSINYESTVQQGPSITSVFAGFTWSPQYPDVGERISFESHSYSNGIITYERWTFGDGSTADGRIVSHTYNRKGSYTVTLEVYADLYENGSMTVGYGYSSNLIKVGYYPHPIFTLSPENPVTGENVTFDASGSLDPKGEIVKYRWSYTNESEPNSAIEMGYSKTLTYNWNKQGNYRITLNLTDNKNNTNEITKTIVVSILRIENITGSFGHIVFQITNRGNITAEDIQWKVYVNRNFLKIPLWKIFYKTGTINALSPGKSTSVDIGRYRRGFGRINMFITVEASNAVKITAPPQGFMFGVMFGKYVHLRS